MFQHVPGKMAKATHPPWSNGNVRRGNTGPAAVGAAASLLQGCCQQQQDLHPSDNSTSPPYRRRRPSMARLSSARLGGHVKVLLGLASLLHVFLFSCAENTKPHKYAEPAELPIKMLQLRAQNFSDSIIQITKDATGYNDLLTEYLLMRPRVVPLDGRALLLQVKDTVEADLRGKVEAVESILIGAEYTYKKYVNPKKKHEPFDYLRAKRLNTTAFQLSESSKFRNKPVNFSLSTIHVPSSVFDESQSVLRSVLWTRRLNFDFKKNHQHDRTMKWQYFCSIEGVFRIFPGIVWPFPNDEFDCRSQRWYTQAISSPKDVIILLDTSGSMTGFARDVAMATTTQILDSLTSNDFFNVMLVSDDVSYLNGCLESILIQATAQNKKRVKKLLREISARGISNFEQALVDAFTILNQVIPRTESESEPREPTGGAGGNQAIMVITTGVTEEYAHVFAKYNSHDQKVRVFSYHVGPQVTGTHQTRIMACNNAGFYSHIRNLADVREKVQHYVHVMSRPMVMEKARHTAWTGPYKDTLGLGTVLTISRPVYDKKNETAFKLLGVVGVDVLVRDLEKHAPAHKLGVNGYAYAIDNNGHVLFHPELKTKWGNHHSPYLESTPLDVLEQGASQIEEVQQAMVQRESGSKSLTATIMFDNDRRVTKRKQTYFYAPVENSPYSVAVVLPDAYGRNWLDGRRKVADVALASFKTSKGKLATWVFIRETARNTQNVAAQTYCRASSNDSRPDPLETVLRYMDHGQNMRPEYATRCDMELMESLLFDAQATRAAQNFWWKDAMLDHDISIPAPPQPKHGIEVTFVGTKAGFTRYFSLSDTFLDSQFMAGQLNTVHEVYYQRSADSPNFIFSVPHQTGKRTSSDEPPVVTISKSLVMSQHGLENIPAVAGMQIKYENLLEVFINATSICPETDEPCPATCESPELDCFLLDENGYVILSDISWEVGKFFGELDGTLMSALIQSGEKDEFGHQQGIFTKVEMYNHQSMCEVWTRKDSSAPSVSLNPFRSIIGFIFWAIQELAIFLVEFNVHSLFKGRGVRASDPSPEGPDRLRDLDNVQDVMEEVLSRLTKFGDSDQVHIWKEDLFREKDVTKEHVLQWYEKLRTQYGTRFEGHEACVKQVPAYMVDMDALPQSMAITSCGWCTRPFTVQRVWQTNLILLVADQKCYCQNDPPLLTSPTRLENNDTLECEKVKAATFRQRPSHKFIRQPEEDTRECGVASHMSPSPALVFTLVMMTVYNMTSSLWPSPRVL